MQLRFSYYFYFTYQYCKTPVLFSLLLVCLLFSSSSIRAQNVLIINEDFRINEKESSYIKSNEHTSMRSLKVISDTSKELFLSNSKNYLVRKLVNKSLLQMNKGGFSLHINPSFCYQYQNEINKQRDVNETGIGLNIKGSYKNKFIYYFDFLTFNSTFPKYVESLVKTTDVVPGEGFASHTNTGYAYKNSTLLLSYTPYKYFSFEAGNGKNFFGDGYRSLFLSDNSSNYPYFKITTNIWKFKYENLWANFKDISNSDGNSRLYQNKFGAFHYLSWNIFKRLNVSFFEAIIWQEQDSAHYRGFEMSYANPVIFYRPVEFTQGSPDNALMGLNIKFKILNKWHLYGQLLLDEFDFNHVKTRDGWWANKQAFQAGMHVFDLFTLKNLSFQSEINYVRPYTYTHVTVVQNYAHYAQSLAHPLGANFNESVSFLRYTYKRFFAEGEFLYAIYGADPEGKNYGGNIYFPYTTHPNEFGNYVGQGIKTTLLYSGIKLNFLLNPSSNTWFEVGGYLRRTSSVVSSTSEPIVFIGIKTFLKKSYRDF